MLGLAARFALREEHRREPPQPDNAPKLPEGKERDKGNDHNQHPGAELIDTDQGDLVKDRCEALFVEQPLHEALDDAEQKHQRAEEHRLEQYREDERSIFEPSAETKRPSDENHLGDNERLDYGDSVMDINDAELGKNQPAIVRERTEEDGEVEHDDPVRLQFLDCQILQSGAMATLVFRGCHSDCFPDCARSSSSARIGTP